ncbi:uncharacterized protein BDR25DRAFT_54409 [Lindgomyces ingoldianus]|uniref:Uncharacterized protein n=1 Tax=Lindgomyces ingoldianus TaxID=673940 RepID=A0ACB6QPL6_9PLEO|nr:uncharacterized protein BDR25DRAFT_54409 [Lindgomyces ingoldianus]KAF2468959.1 hypothetical protein BDR25DRAFT_54409 [Lindgomyces ingoldianus]
MNPHTYATNTIHLHHPTALSLGILPALILIVVKGIVHVCVSRFFAHLIKMKNPVHISTNPLNTHSRRPPLKNTVSIIFTLKTRLASKCPCKKNKTRRRIPCRLGIH